MQQKAAQLSRSDFVQKAQIASLYEGDQYRDAISQMGNVQVTNLGALSVNGALSQQLANVSFNGNNAVTLGDGYEIDAKIPKIANAQQINIFYSSGSETGMGRVTFIPYTDQRQVLTNKNLAIPGMQAFIRSISSDINATSTVSNIGTTMSGQIASGNITGADSSMSGALRSIGGVGSWFVISFPAPTDVNMVKIQNVPSQNPNETIALDFSDGTTVVANLNQTNVSTIEFPDVYTKEIRVRVLSVYPALTSYNSDDTGVSFAYSPFQKILQGIAPNQAYADNSGLSSSAYSSSQVL